MIADQGSSGPYILSKSDYWPRLQWSLYIFLIVIADQGSSGPYIQYYLKVIADQG